MQILKRYLLWELIPPLLLSLVILTFILLVGNMIRLTDLVMNKGVSLWNVLQLFSCMVPYLLSYSIPMALLTGTLLAFGRLAADNEITTLRACGLNLYRLVVPILILGVGMSLFCVYLNDQILPRARFASRKIMTDIGMKNPTAYLEAGQFIKSFQDYVIFIYEIDGQELRHIRIYHTPENQPTKTIIAERGQLIPDPLNQTVILKLYDGTIDQPNPKNPASYYKMNFRDYSVRMDISKDLQKGKLGKKPKDMTLNELRHESRELAGRANTLPLTVEFHKKISFSFASLAFVWIALPLAIWARRGEKSVGFALSFVVMAVYYGLFIGGEAMALKGIVPAPWVLWIPNVVTLAAGAIGTYWVVQR